MYSDKENSKYGHKIDYLLSWKDKKSDEWEIAIEEFCRKSFESARNKYKDDLYIRIFGIILYGKYFVISDDL